VIHLSLEPSKRTSPAGQSTLSHRCFRGKLRLPKGTRRKCLPTHCRWRMQHMRSN